MTTLSTDQLWSEQLLLFFSCKRFVPFCLLGTISAELVCMHRPNSSEVGKSFDLVICVIRSQGPIAILVWHGFGWFSNIKETHSVSSLYFSNMLIFSSSFLSITHKPAMQLDWKCLLELCSWLWILYVGKLRDYILNNAHLRRNKYALTFKEPFDGSKRKVRVAKFQFLWPGQYPFAGVCSHIHTVNAAIFEHLSYFGKMFRQYISLVLKQLQTFYHWNL